MVIKRSILLHVHWTYFRKEDILNNVCVYVSGSQLMVYLQKHRIRRYELYFTAPTSSRNIIELRLLSKEYDRGPLIAESYNNRYSASIQRCFNLYGPLQSDGAHIIRLPKSKNIGSTRWYSNDPPPLIKKDYFVQCIISDMSLRVVERSAVSAILVFSVTWMHVEMLFAIKHHEEQTIHLTAPKS
jgi:hypothetical protein